MARLDGKQFGPTVNPTHAISWKRLRDGADHTFEIRARPHVPGGVLYAAYYTPES